MQEHLKSGLHYLKAATTLLQRLRSSHPVKGLYEAADLQWRWRVPRPTDDMPQLFWCDESGRPEAAAILTDWNGRVTLDPITLPDAAPAVVAQVVARGLAHAQACGFTTFEVEVDTADAVMRDILTSHGLSATGEGMVETWLAASNKPAVSLLHDGYRLATRADTKPQPHHMIKRSGAAIEKRLGETSLYRPDLDLLILDAAGTTAAYGLFWYDPVTATGLVEPMRTEDGHQQKGLARHILTAGIDRLVAAGATRIKICFDPGNPASKGLYLSAGFEPAKQTDVFIR